MAHKPVLTCLSGDGLSCNSVSVYVILHELVGRYAEYVQQSGGFRKMVLSLMLEFQCIIILRARS